MPERIFEIAEDQRHLSMFRGFMLVESTENHRTELGCITSLVDWDMYSDRNLRPNKLREIFSLVDWDMYSDRNLACTCTSLWKSLVDWEMYSDRNVKVGVLN